MNKKISTLFTAGLLVAGSLCGSAWAQGAQTPAENSILGILRLNALPTAASALENGQYLMVNGTDSKAYGFDGTSQKLVSVSGSDASIQKDTDVQKYVWEVSVSQPAGSYVYTFTNVASGKKLTVSSNKGALADKAGDAYFGTSKNAYSSTNNKMYMFVPKNGDVAEATYALEWDASGLKATKDGVTASAITFYPVSSIGFDKASELNALYNGSGFSFESARLNGQTAEPVGNLFNEKRITAVYVDGRGIEVDKTVDPEYAGTNADLKIKSGMYFFTENAPIKADGSVNTDYKAWMDATIVAVSSTETVEATNTDRNNGNGFSLVEVKVSDMNFYQGSNNAWKTAGNEISINNARFTVKKSYTSNYPYALALDDFRYQKSDGSHTDGDVQLHVLQHSNAFYLTTQKIDGMNKMNQFIFKLAPAGMKKGIELLNKEAKVAAYNIRVLSGDDTDVQSLYGKYLTNAVDNGSFVYVAKAKVLAQPETPAYQWAITSVEDTYNVVFTNRETSVTFKASLFPKADLGENVYELAIAGNDKVTPIYVDENTYNEAANADNDHKMSMNTLIVELIPAEVDPYAGFLNVDDKTLVTMAFARDNNETSNKWYAGVVEDPANTFKLNKNDEFSNKLSGAAQWQLVKSEDSLTIIERSFVYNRDGRVTVQAKGDKAYAYTYKLQYVNDGKEKEVYFPEEDDNNTKFAVAENTTLASKVNAPEFIIKVAADGAVYLIEDAETAANAASIFEGTGNNATTSEVRVIYSDSQDEYQYATNRWSVYKYPVASQDLLLKTYLIVEAPEVSYPAEEGYISLVSEWDNYVSVNDNREGIVVDEAQYSFYLNVTDTNAVVPSFYISKALEGVEGRAYLFQPEDSVNYYVAEGSFDRVYQWKKDTEKAIFKAGVLNAGRDTIATDIKGNRVNVAEKADDNGVLGGLDNFKVQIILVEDTDDQYYIRSVANSQYLYNWNDQLAWGSKEDAMKFTIMEGDPTANEAIANEVEGVKVIAGNGTVEIQGAAGKNVVIANILGKVVASTTLTSDNQTINVPAGIVVVTVDGEAVKAVVR